MVWSWFYKLQRYDQTSGFSDINFDELRAKRTRCSLRVKFWMGGILNKKEKPHDVTLQQLEKEEEYCGKLWEIQKQVFRLDYIG